MLESGKLAIFTDDVSSEWGWGCFLESLCLSSPSLGWTKVLSLPWNNRQREARLWDGGNSMEAQPEGTPLKTAQ